MNQADGPEAALPSADTEKKETTDQPLTSAKQTLDDAGRSMALRHWEQAADQYAVALETL